MSLLTSRSSRSQRRSSRQRSSKLRPFLRHEALERRNLMAVVATDLPDYAPGATANIYASGYQVGEAVQFQVLHNDGTPNTGGGHAPWTVVDGSLQDLDGLVDGNIHTTWYVDPDDSNHSSFDLTALGLSSGLSAFNTFTDVGSTLSQFANKPSTQYQTGSLNASNSAYVEGDSIPFRYLVSDLREDACVVLDIIYQFQSSAAGPRTYDFLTTDNVTQGVTDTERFGPNNASKPSGFGLTSSTNLLNVAIPDDPSISTDTGGSFRVASNVPVSLVSVSTPVISSSPDEKVIRLVLQLGNDGDATPNENIVDLGVFWGGHLARDTDYAGANNGASDAPGASFHMRTEGFHDINCDGDKDSGEDNLGGGDRSIQGGVVVNTSLAWEKRRADTGALQGGATFTLTPNPFTGLGTLTIVDNGAGDLDPDAGQIQIDDIKFGTYTITETVAPAGFALDPDNTRVQSVTTAAPVAVVGTQGMDDPGITDESDFHNPLQLGSIAWEKRNEATSALLGGATFTIAANPLTGSGSLIVVDDTDGVTSPGDVDRNPNPGQFLINDVLYGTYTVTETVAPSGFLIDDAPSRTVTVSQANLNAVIGVQGQSDPGNTNTSDFFNPAVNAQINIDKETIDDTASGDGINILAGESINWLYTVTNTGNVPLSNITVTDDQGVTPTYISGDANNNSVLELTETWIYTAAGTSVAGSYNNIGSATGNFTDSSGTVHNASDSDPSSYFGADPVIDIVKVTDDGTFAGDGLYIQAGMPITWRYTVTNAGNVALSNVTVTDNQPGVAPTYVSGDTNNDNLLDLGETWLFTAAGVAVAGDYSNVGTATGSYQDTAGHIATPTDMDDSSYFGFAPQINVVKITIDDTASGDGINIHAGESITWQYTVTNTGNVALSNVTVTDNQPGVAPTYVSGDANNDGYLDLTETWIFTATGTSIAGAYNNLGTAEGTYLFNDDTERVVVSDTDPSSYFGLSPQIAISKLTADGPVAGDGIIVQVGEPISWRYTVSNAGNVALANVTVTDDQGVVPVYQSGDTNNDSKLDLTEVWVYTAAGVSAPGIYTNTGTANGSVTDTAGHVKNTTASDESSYFGAVPQIAINKLTVDGPVAGDGIIIHVGEPISWRYTVSNAGNIVIKNVSVTDNQPGVTPTYVSGDVNNDNVLDLNETWVYTAVGTSAPGIYMNTGTASGNITDTAGHVKDTTASDDSAYFGAVPSVSINKVTISGAQVGDGITVNTGDMVTWQYTVTNTGNITLNNIVVTDNKPGVTPVYQSGDVNNDGVLDLGEAWVYTANGTAVAGSYNNIGKVQGDRADTAGHIKTVMATDASSYVGLCDIIVIGPDKQNTSTPLVKVIDKNTGAVLSQFYAYEPSFKGGVRLATGDMTGDGIDEIIVAPGRGRAPEVRVFTQAGVELMQFRTMAYASNFTGGVEVAVGDIDGNGTNDLVTVPTSGVTQARVFYNTPAAADPLPNAPSRSFNVFPSTFLGGADVVVADMGTFNNGTVVNANVPDGKSEIIIGNGPGMRSTVYVYDMTGATPKVVDTILPFSNTFKGGVTLDAARINGDMIPDLIVAAGNGGNSAVQVYSGIVNDAVDQLLTSFFAFNNTTTPNAPVHTTTLDSNNDGIADAIVAVQGTDGKSNQIRCFNTNGTPKGTPLSGFTGPRNVARLRCPSPQLTDLVFAELGQ